MLALKEKQIVVTGGSGFLGSHLVELLRARGCRKVFIPRSSKYDLCKQDAIARMFDDAKPQIIIHLAAVVGGIGANRENPGKFYYENMIMGAELMEQARRRGVEKFVAVGTVCAYPKFAEVPFRDDVIWSGYPEENK